MTSGPNPVLFLLRLLFFGLPKDRKAASAIVTARFLVGVLLIILYGKIKHGFFFVSGFAFVASASVQFALFILQNAQAKDKATFQQWEHRMRRRVARVENLRPRAPHSPSPRPLVKAIARPQVKALPKPPIALRVKPRPPTQTDEELKPTNTVPHLRERRLPPPKRIESPRRLINPALQKGDCPQCAGAVEPHFRFCPHCAHVLSPSTGSTP